MQGTRPWERPVPLYSSTAGMASASSHSLCVTGSSTAAAGMTRSTAIPRVSLTTGQFIEEVRTDPRKHSKIRRWCSRVSKTLENVTFPMKTLENPRKWGDFHIPLSANLIELLMLFFGVVYCSREAAVSLEDAKKRGSRSMNHFVNTQIRKKVTLEFMQIF